MHWQKRFIGILFFGLTSIISTPTESQIMKRPCTPSIEPAITVTLFNLRTKAPIEGNIVVEDRRFRERLILHGATASGQKIYGGAFERPSTYTLRISQIGYRSTTIRKILVGKDECHVLTRHLNIGLEPI